ncbi:hypothetical protein [Enterococcus sp. DIV0806c]|uniref:hypothetical protein n=1 Tax=unclassified Enterococcus TaxID=2608891 RepID=UPI003F280508
MKKMLATILSTATIVGVVASGTKAFATQTIDGREGDTSGDVQVNGIIGEFDNTTPGPNPDDLNQWINVTIPTTALFYTTEESSHKEIVSPSYTVTNNSAVGVITSVTGVDTPLKMDEVDLLNVNGIELFSEGKPTVAETELFTLEGNQGKNEGTFTFAGEATPVNTSEESNPSFKLVLSFAPDVDED